MNKKIHQGLNKIQNHNDLIYASAVLAAERLGSKTCGGNDIDLQGSC